MDIGKRFVVAQQHVVARHEALDQVAFEQQRLDLGVGDDDFHRARLGDHALQPVRQIVDLGVVGDPVLEIARLADIERVALGARACDRRRARAARSARHRGSPRRPVRSVRSPARRPRLPSPRLPPAYNLPDRRSSTYCPACSPFHPQHFFPDRAICQFFPCFLVYPRFRWKTLLRTTSPSVGDRMVTPICRGCPNFDHFSYRIDFPVSNYDNP